MSEERETLAKVRDFIESVLPSSDCCKERQQSEDFSKKCSFSFRKLKMNERAKKYAQWFLAFTLGLCSLWQVSGELMKFLGASTTLVLEKQHHNHLHLPQVALCMKQRYNYEALIKMGLSIDFFSEMRQRTENNLKSLFPDLNETWLKATWSREDVQMEAATGATHTSATLVSKTEGMHIWFWKSDYKCEYLVIQFFQL